MKRPPDVRAKISASLKEHFRKHPRTCPHIEPKRDASRHCLICKRFYALEYMRRYRKRHRQRLKHWRYLWMEGYARSKGI